VATALRIRRGTARDVPTILALIKGLAEYERLAHEVRATHGALRSHGFGRRPYFETIIGSRDGTPVGFALYFFTYSTFLASPSLYLEDLFVVPEERGRGAGRALLGELARIALRRGCGRMEWAVLDWNAPSIGFYEKLGAQLKREWILTRLTGEPLQRLAREGRAGPTAKPSQRKAQVRNATENRGAPRRGRTAPRVGGTGAISRPPIQ
jgi:GNAT superfamily N-acetyltransferase